jgi:hypothetical protein
VLRKTFGPKRGKVTGDWRRLHNEELHDLLYSSPNIVQVIKSRIMRCRGHMACMGERCIQGSGGETRGKKPLGRPRRRWEDNIKKDLQKVGWAGMDSIDLDRDRWQALLNAVINLGFP